ncbi:MAG: hypothetical protein VX842_06775 [Actinomycetota bacterium]|nr:hypothetical protein [Actinomycetota bacterium]
MASDDGTCCVAAMAGDGFAGDASLGGDHSSNDKRGCDVVQGCRVDCEEDDREEVDRVYDGGEEAGCRLELVAAGRVIPVSCTRRVLELVILELPVLGAKART